MQAREAVIVDTVRTAIGKRKGALANWHPTDLLGFALRSLLERNDVDPGMIDDVVGGCVTQSGERNEAFAAIALMWAKEFRPDPARYNPRGGAIAIGHPLGASGVRLMTTMLNHLEATGGRLGFQTMCEGGGQANATVIDRLG